MTAIGLPRAWSRRLALTALSLGLALGVCECALRWLDLGVLPMPRRQGAIHADSENPVLGHEPIPGASRSYSIQRARRAPPVQVTEGFNQLGVRGPLFPAEKADGVFRIACVGDSFTFGYLVGEDETWPVELQRRLDRLGRAGAFEVWNFGVYGYETPQEVEYLRTRVLAFEPDLVLIAYYLNDAIPLEERERLVARDAGGGLGGSLRNLLNPDTRGWLAGLRRRSVLLDTVADTLWRGLAGREAMRVYTELYQEDGAGWRDAQAGLLSARDLLAARGIDLALVLYPHFARQGDGFTSDAAYDIVESFCRRSAIRVLDLGPAFVGQEVADLRVHPYDFHPSALANRIAGQTIAAFLADEGLLPLP